MKNYLFFTLLFSLFFACKKDNTNTPAVVRKELEVSGMVIDFETGKPLEGVLINLNGSASKRLGIKGYSATTLTDIQGNYKIKFNANDSLNYTIGAAFSNYAVFFNGYFLCNGCSLLVSPYTFQGVTSEYLLINNFPMAKVGKIKVNLNLGKTPVNDTLFVKKHQFYNSNKISDDYPSRSNYENYPLVPINFKTLADRMTYLTWKLKSEMVWHQDSIMTPFGKTVDFEIKY